MKFNEINSIKALAIIGVLLAHSTFIDRYDSETIQVLEYFQILFGWCVIAFFYTSGFLYGEYKYEFPYEFIKKRFTRLIIPMIIFSITYKLIIYFLYKFNLINNKPEYFTNFFNVIKFFIEPIGPQFYFLFYLFLISVFYSIIYLVFKSQLKNIIISLLCLMVYFFIELPLQGYGSGYNLIPIYIISYLAGIQDRIKFDIKLYLLILVFTFIYYFRNDNLVIIYLLMPTLMYLFFKYFNVFNKLISIFKLGEYSSSIYVWHAPIVMPISNIIVVNIMGNNLFSLFLTILITLLVCYLIKFIINNNNFLRIYKF